MTTIAFDGKYLAADRRVGDGTRVKKIRVLRNGGYLAASGYLDDLIEVARWIDGGMRDETNPYRDVAPSDEGRNSFIYIDPRGRAHTLTHPWLRPVAVANRLVTFGSGGDIALGAMAAGASARRAVQLACRFDPRTGGGVDVVRVK